MRAVYLAFANQSNNRSLLRFLRRHLTKNPYRRIQGCEVTFTWFTKVASEFIMQWVWRISRNDARERIAKIASPMRLAMFLKPGEAIREDSQSFLCSVPYVMIDAYLR